MQRLYTGMACLPVSKRCGTMCVERPTPLVVFCPLPRPSLVLRERRGDMQTAISEENLISPEPAAITQPSESSTLGVARAASIIALGNITSRVMGLARETIKSHLFGAT